MVHLLPLSKTNGSSMYQCLPASHQLGQQVFRYCFRCGVSSASGHGHTIFLLVSSTPLHPLLQQLVRKPKKINPAWKRGGRKKKKREKGRWGKKGEGGRGGRHVQLQPLLLGQKEGTEIICFSTSWGQTLSDLLSHRHRVERQL